MAQPEEKVEFIFDAPQPIIAINSTGGVVLAPAATREKLALYIVQHQKEQHGPKAVFLGAMSLVGLACVGFFATRVIMNLAAKYWRDNGKDDYE